MSIRSGAWFVVVGCVAGMYACGSDESSSTPGPKLDAGNDAAVDATPDSMLQTCGSAGSTLPAGTDLVWDDGMVDGNLRAGTGSITVDGTIYALNEVPIWEAVRFELEHPATILGFDVMWANVPDGAEPTLELQAGLYRDFGHNGFDFWAKEPLWEGTRCAGDVEAGAWTSYALPSPVSIDHPGLVYVAHHAPAPTSPVFAFGKTAAADCELFDNCRSAINIPDAPGYFNGVSFSFQRNYLVRLRVKYTDQVAAKDKVFQPLAATEGQHISFADYDADGDDDALVQGKLLRNDKGSFVDVSTSAGLSGVAATGGVFGDYDNDGCLDLFLYAEAYDKPDSLMRSNCDGTFTDVTAAAGIGDVQSYETCGDAKNVHAPSAAAAWADLDADGYLDLYLADFICWEKETFYSDQVFHNEGNGTFSEWSGLHGFSSIRRASRGVAPADADGDGDIDLFINNYRLQPNQYYVNNGDGTVAEKASGVGLAGKATPQGISAYYGHTIGAAWGDLDNDGDLDLVAANLAHPRFFHFSNKTQILLNDGKGNFSDHAGVWDTPFGNIGLRYQETHSVPVLADFDNDGNLDLVITAVYDGRPTDFYWGNGDGSFRLDSYHAGITTENGWGAAAADIDDDGDVDLFATGLFENKGNGVTLGHFVQARVIGNVAANRAGIGARVFVKAGSKTWLRQVQGGSGKGGQDSLTLHFGVGAVTNVDEVRVVFPGGKSVTFPGPIAVDQRLWLYEDGSMKTGMTPP